MPDKPSQGPVSEKKSEEEDEPVVTRFPSKEVLHEVEPLKLPEDTVGA
ncbi:MAG: hypothetical protein WBD46_17610 [Acidobacteriaceae bacterium]